MRIRMLTTLAALTAALSLSACSEKPPKSLEEIPGVVKINDPNFSAAMGTLVIDIKAERFYRFSVDAVDTLRKVKLYFPSELDRYKKIWVFGTSSLVDKYGNQSSHRTVGIEWPTEELKKAHLEEKKLVTWDVLNLASDVRRFNRAGDEMFIEYCKEENSQKYAASFYMLYVNKYMH